jgi:CheY-like chemotaxis protein
LPVTSRIASIRSCGGKGFFSVFCGAKLARELQVIRSRPSIRVLFTTGYARNAIVHHGRLDPGVELLPKPYTRPDLARRVREVLDRN